MDRRLTAPLGRNRTAVCECGWELWRERGFTRKQAYEAVSRHHRTECTLPLWTAWRSRMEVTH